jgi:hypothetical protein
MIEDNKRNNLTFFFALHRIVQKKGMRNEIIIRIMRRSLFRINGAKMGAYWQYVTLFTGAEAGKKTSRIG